MSPVFEDGSTVDIVPAQVASPDLPTRLRGYQNEMLCNEGVPGSPFDSPLGVVMRDLGMAAADIELLRREIAAVREKRSELRGGTGDG